MLLNDLFVMMLRYGLLTECTQKYGNTTAWDLLNDVFDYLPLSALIDERILCLHGGLSPHCISLNQLRQLPRGNDVPFDGLIAGLSLSLSLPLSLSPLLFSFIFTLLCSDQSINQPTNQSINQCYL